MNTKLVLNFIRERHSIWLKRQAGLKAPWTIDSIFREYRFCNVYRELDKVTVWISKNWREPNFKDPDMWFAMVIARFINYPDTLQEIGYPVPFDLKHFTKVCNNRRAAGSQVYTGAYMIRADRVPGGKADYLAKYVFEPLWQARDKVRPRSGETLQAFYERLRGFRDMGGFMAAQVVADVKLSILDTNETPDWWTFAASGPGSRRGMNRVCGREVNAPWKEEEWHAKLLKLRDEINPVIAKWGYLPLCGQGIQHNLCEVDKYERVRLGQGEPRSKYRPPVDKTQELFG